ncbi:MAG TPA: DUF4476 domain-containing protein [Chitinophagaceae bacterium]|nr:DUF4476 domain-containing protein [Chitinophagaceae bacterium]
MSKFIKILFASCFICALFNSNRLNAQQNHFIYIQADDKQTFSVNVNGKTYNSSEIGYVIIPKLTDGKYQLNISFPNNKFPGRQFNCVIKKADAGYALKNFGDKGWGLFNFQSLEITMASAEAAVPEVQKDTVVQKDTAKTNAFGDMLSQVVNDTTLKVAPIDQSANKPTTIPPTEIKKELPSAENVAASLNDSLKKAQNQVSTTDTISALNKSITKIEEQKTDEGVNMVFVDQASGNDTIKIFLPSQPAPQKKTEDSAIAKKVKPDSAAVDTTQPVTEVKTEEKSPATDTSVSTQGQVNNPFFSKKQATDTANKTDTVNKSVPNNTPIENKQAETTPSQTMYKSDCAKMLSDNDLDKLKKKIVGANGDDKMIQTAKKYFQDKCITTEQVKSLGALFLTDDARYSFFDTAYPYVYDVSAFASLENQLIDPYYKKRFKAMLK